MAKLPTPDEVALLLDKGILTKEEAREILISQETDEDRDKNSLQEEIKFLRELVQKLSNRTDIVKQIEYIQVPYKKYDWYAPYQVYCSSQSGLTGSLTNTSYATTATNDAIYLTSGTGSISYSASPDFTSIKTF
jgi:hypothetical protein